MKTILVTGGAGFIGSCFIKHLLSKSTGYKIINLDMLTYAGRLANLEEIADNKNYEFVRGNICDKQLVKNLIQNCDYVINFAAETHVDRSINSADIFVETNINGTFSLLEASKERGIERYLQVSTDEVYGSLDRNGYFYETTALAPNSPYSASKAAADLMVLSYYKTYGLDVVITRCSNNYGPYQYPEKLIPFFIKKLLNGEKVPIYGDGLNVRDWLYVYDHCEALYRVLFNGRAGEIYNIGGHNEKNNLEITKIILDIMNLGYDRIEFVSDRPGHDRRYAVSNDKISLELGWAPAVTFEEGIKHTVNWYLNHPEYLKMEAFI